MRWKGCSFVAGYRLGRRNPSANISSFSPDGKDWTNLTYLAQQTDGLLGLPPGAFTFFDEPGVGTWHYDVHAATFQSATLQFAGVRLVAQSLGGAP